MSDLRTPAEADDFDQRRARWIAETRRQLDALAEKWGIAVDVDEQTADPQPAPERPTIIVIDAGGLQGAAVLAGIRAAGLLVGELTADRPVMTDDLMRPADLAALMVKRLDERPIAIETPDRRQTRAEWRRAMKGMR